MTEKTFRMIHDSCMQRIIPLLGQLRKAEFCIVDNFLPDTLCDSMREESVNLFKKSLFSPSQTTKWDEVSNSVITYEKRNVLAMQLNGGEDYWESPRLHEYLVQMTKSCVPHLQQKFPEAHICSSMTANKLAVCLGDGSSYEKHFDHSGSDDMRKITIVFYMNKWRPAMGGCFRVHSGDGVVDISPIRNRLLIFWSDRLPHSVQPSFVASEQDHRYALTLWLSTTHSATIARECAL